MKRALLTIAVVIVVMVMFGHLTTPSSDMTAKQPVSISKPTVHPDRTETERPVDTTAYNNGQKVGKFLRTAWDTTKQFTKGVFDSVCVCDTN